MVSVVVVKWWWYFITVCVLAHACKREKVKERAILKRSHKLGDNVTDMGTLCKACGDAMPVSVITSPRTLRVWPLGSPPLIQTFLLGLVQCLEFKGHI